MRKRKRKEKEGEKRNSNPPIINLTKTNHSLDSSMLIRSVSRYLRYVKPSFDNFVLPTSRYANIVSHMMATKFRLLKRAEDCTRDRQFCCNRADCYSHPSPTQGAC